MRDLTLRRWCGLPHLPNGNPEALELRNENRQHWIERDPEVKCYLPGIPRANYRPFPFEIMQNAGRFFFGERTSLESDPDSQAEQALVVALAPRILHRPDQTEIARRNIGIRITEVRRIGNIEGLAP